MNKLAIALPLAAALAACGSDSAGNGSGANSSVQAAGVTGAGSTFVYPVLSAWAADYSSRQASTSTTSRSAPAAELRK